MKTKKSGVRGSVVTSADLEKAIKALERYLEKSNLIVNGCPIVFGSGTPFDDALAPFDLVANGGRLRADKKVLDRFAVAWFEVAHDFKGDGVMWCHLSLVRVLQMFSKSGLSDFNCGVFVADYGYFRGVLTECLYWNISRIGGGSSGVISDIGEIGDKVSGVEKSMRKTDAKARKAELAASEARLLAKGEWTDRDIKAAQVQIAVENFKGNIRNALLAGLQPTCFHGRMIDGDVGYLPGLIDDGIVKRQSGEIVVLKGFPSKGYYQRVYRVLDGLGKLNHGKKLNG